jgi:hypothetical protein
MNMENETEKEVEETVKQINKGCLFGFSFAGGMVLFSCFSSLVILISIYQCGKELENPNSRTNKKIEKEAQKMSEQFNRYININEQKTNDEKPKDRNYNFNNWKKEKQMMEEAIIKSEQEKQKNKRDEYKEEKEKEKRKDVRNGLEEAKLHKAKQKAKEDEIIKDMENRLK